MADRPENPQHPDEPTGDVPGGGPGPGEPTEQLPPSGERTEPLPPAADPTNPPSPGTGWAAGPGEQGAPVGGGAYGAPAPPYGTAGQPYGTAWTPAAAAAGPPRPNTARRLWGEATGTTGGRLALAAVGVLAILVLVAGVGLVASLVVHHRDRVELSSQQVGPRGPGVGPNGQGKGKGNGNGNGKGWSDDGGVPGPGQGPGRNRQGQAAPGQNGLGQNGLGGLLGGMGGLGAVLHGEFTTSVTGTPTVMVFQTGQVTAYTAGKSLTVKSTDGFEATYTLDSSTSGRGTASLANGSQVRVVAAKEGMKAVLVVAG
jgi:hypothetical protein